MQPPAETKSTFYRYRHWLIYACIYAVIMFVLVFQLDRVNVVALCLSVGLFLATAELVAVWCVYSPGRFSLRVVSSFLVASIALAGILLAIYASPRMPKEAKHVAIAVTFLFPMFCCASQIPHWIVRLVFGWQFVFDGQRPSVTFKLSDLFFATLLVALALAGTRMAATSFIKTIPDDAVAEINRYDLEGNAEGAVDKQELENGIPLAFLLYSLPAIVWASAKLPILFFAFGSRNAKRAFWVCGCFMAACLFALFLIVSFSTGVTAGLAGGFGILVAFVTLSVFAFAVPLLHSRARGMQFKRFSRVTDELNVANDGS